ncbi:hypothetical protein SAMN05443575_0703 [Jatrophihabitans endophyticus]|uniref:Uncharacterized protein n=1 Tax=Jatrophihabitans endophyticus TaxID=1206085 RepID=A0A1M5DUP9_9ACTN|nr:hypothetical protein [Jatrophihabitans endophyticus]SHF70733.1 hypothetical protein SAMN05443575_0703 [Jatrophihabitans endophyticus]
MSETGPDTPTRDDLRRQLRDVDEQLQTLRGEAGGLRDQIGGQDDGPQDPEDRAAAMTNAEETAALITSLEQRRASLAERIGED